MDFQVIISVVDKIIGLLRKPVGLHAEDRSVAEWRVYWRVTDYVDREKS